VGTPAEHQRLVLKRNGTPIAELSDNSRMLGFYSPLSGDEIHIIDTDPFSLSRGGGLTDVSLVQKYRMTDEEYERRSGTMREYIKKQRELDPNFKLKPKGAAAPRAASSEPEADCGPDSVAGIAVGQRCEVMPGARRGVVCYVGEIDGLKAGYWVSYEVKESAEMFFLLQAMLTCIIGWSAFG
jgi:tubulin-folding cofactor B